MNTFNINWDGISYSVPTIHKAFFQGEEIFTNPDKAIYIIKPSESDIIIYKKEQFLDLHGDKIESEVVKSAFRNYIV